MGSLKQVAIEQDAEGNMWVCDEYDHGPLCRLCIPVTDPTIRKAMIELSLQRMVNA